MELEKAFGFIDEARDLGAACINIMGGEPMLYTHIDRLTRKCAENGLQSNIATSGYNLTEEKIRILFENGLTRLFISLNGSDNKINIQLRYGFNTACKALEILGNIYPERVYVLWVMHKYNIKNFSNFLIFIENLNIRNICILKIKNCIDTMPHIIPDAIDAKYISDIMYINREKFTFYPDLCHADLLYEIHPSMKATGEAICTAGKEKCCINADGTFSPCSHLNVREKYVSLQDYWNNSVNLDKIRSGEIQASAGCQ